MRLVVKKVKAQLVARRDKMAALMLAVEEEENKNGRAQRSAEHAEAEVSQGHHHATVWTSDSI